MTTTTTVVGKVKAPDGTVVEGAEILARLNGFDYDEEFGYITSRRISTTTDANGEFSFELWPNTRGTEGTIYRIVINSPVNGVSTNFTATIPEQDEVELNDAADFDPVPPLSDSEQLVNEAKAFKDKAKAFATEAEDVEVETGLFSALHYSEKAEDSAIAAAASESNAATSESNAASSASAASTSASNAATSESNAASSASAAATSETNAQTAETGAVSAKDDAVAAKNATESIFDTFDDRFLGSFSSAPTTDNDGNPIVAGAVYYDTTQQEVYFYNGATWDAPAAQAETSATNALASENAAATSESNAATSESNAASSETAAANSASAAATSESNAATSETNAASSASAAATSESNAATSESNAAASESAAATSESNAASSASSAATSESNAATSETNAANSASAAATSETNAANSASAAATSESNAATSAQNAADSFDSFDDRYLGSKTSEPTTDNDGDPLLEGALYYDSTSGALRFYDGTAWNTIATRSDAEIRDLFSGSGDIVYNSSTGDFSVTTYKSSDFDTDFGTKDTDDLTEGTGNLYYTDARARGAVSASGDLSYNASTGEFSFTETPNYTDADVDAHLTGGTGVTYSTGTISIGQDVGTGADVQFNSINVDSGTLFVDSANNRVGVGTSSPAEPLSVKADNTSATAVQIIDRDANSVASLNWVNTAGSINCRINNTGQNLRFFTGGDNEAARIDSSGNLLVGTTDDLPDQNNNEGISLRTSSLGGRLAITRTSEGAAFLNRKSTDGEILQFLKDGSTVGSIGTISLDIYLGGDDNFIRFTGNDIRPVESDGSNRDNQTDLGDASSRFDDIFATNGTIQTSDVNEKQDIDVLSDAETRVAAKAKTLLRKYRWKSAVEDKGDEARIHFGIIAQDLEQAFIDEGLDAGRYGMFIRGEWYEAEVENTRTVENADGTETTETYMATETYDTAEEAPADAVHKERLGVRYHELLAFIIAAI